MKRGCERGVRALGVWGARAEWCARVWKEMESRKSLGFSSICVIISLSDIELDKSGSTVMVELALRTTRPLLLHAAASVAGGQIGCEIYMRHLNITALHSELRARSPTGGRKLTAFRAIALPPGEQTVER